MLNKFRVKCSFIKCAFTLVIGIVTSQLSHAETIELVAAHSKVTILYDSVECKLNGIAANLLADDIERVSGYRPSVSFDINKATGNVIFIGTVSSRLLSVFDIKGVKSEIAGKWECYAYKIANHPRPGVDKALIIAGSDFRGTAFGVFDISAKIGVTPWYWWADVHPAKKKHLSLDIADFISQEPSVKYRGIFINDEDWGLQPWAAKTFEPETGDIGPKTYAKVFELLLRLKANLIWPAMHPSTKAFFSFPGNVKMAEDYQIVIGSSHAEPMLRNNVGEWKTATMGDFNYVTNKQQVDNYWESRVKESSHLNAIYSMGMRGVHDSGIEGVHSVEETVPLLESILDDERALLKKYINPDLTKVPQAFTAYKEVLDVYDAGLKVPQDITLVWPDDNYGYIQRLDDKQEEKRPGGSGIYYHISYWGRPHDYLWLSTTNPGLIREEMTKAYAMDARRIWIVNVGDIKPAEYNIQFFLDMAYRIAPFQISSYSKSHLHDWVADNIDEVQAGPITDILWTYYQLSFQRRPEFMGWSQTEPTTGTGRPEYNANSYGDQEQNRINAWNTLETSVYQLKGKIGKDRSDAFYQLVYYPVVCASLMNKKFLYADKAYAYGQQGRVATAYYDSLAMAAYRQIVSETAYYNNDMSAGKWKNIMSMHPRDLPVFNAPSSHQVVKQQNAFSFQAEDERSPAAVSGAITVLPSFNRYGVQQHFLDIYLTRDTTLDFSIQSADKWIKTSVTKGMLTGKGARAEERVLINIDWTHAPSSGTFSGNISINIGGKSFPVAIHAIRDSAAVQQSFKGFAASDGYICIYAKDYQQASRNAEENWAPVEGLGSTGTGIEAMPVSAGRAPDSALTDNQIKKKPVLTYDFSSASAESAKITVITIPTYPLNRKFHMRYAVSVDDGPTYTLDFQTFGRSNEWKQAVLSNAISRSITSIKLAAGIHHLKIYMIDPGVILDRIVIDFGSMKPFYGLLPESTLITK